MADLSSAKISFGQRSTQEKWAGKQPAAVDCSIGQYGAAKNNKDCSQAGMQLGGGVAHYERPISQSATYGGAQCAGMRTADGEDGEFGVAKSVVCKPQQPAQDCEVSDWGPWSECTRQCNGVQRRYRQVTKLPINSDDGKTDARTCLETADLMQSRKCSGPGSEEQCKMGGFWDGENPIFVDSLTITDPFVTWYVMSTNLSGKHYKMNVYLIDAANEDEEEGYTTEAGDYVPPRKMIGPFTRMDEETGAIAKDASGKPIRVEPQYHSDSSGQMVAPIDAVGNLAEGEDEWAVAYGFGLVPNKWEAGGPGGQPGMRFTLGWKGTENNASEDHLADYYMGRFRGKGRKFSDEEGVSDSDRVQRCRVVDYDADNEITTLEWDFGTPSCTTSSANGRSCTLRNYDSIVMKVKGARPSISRMEAAVRMKFYGAEISPAMKKVFGFNDGTKYQKASFHRPKNAAKVMYTPQNDCDRGSGGACVKQGAQAAKQLCDSMGKGCGTIACDQADKCTLYSDVVYTPNQNDNFTTYTKTSSEDCEWSDWESWSSAQCSTSFAERGGTQQRYRHLTSPAAAAGKCRGQDYEARACKVGPDPNKGPAVRGGAVTMPWNDWQGCDRQCAMDTADNDREGTKWPGHQERQRFLTKAPTAAWAKAHGYPQLGQYQDCNNQLCREGANEALEKNPYHFRLFLGKNTLGPNGESAIVITAGNNAGIVPAHSTLQLYQGSGRGGRKQIKTNILTDQTPAGTTTTITASDIGGINVPLLTNNGATLSGEYELENPKYELLFAYTANDTVSMLKPLGVDKVNHNGSLVDPRRAKILSFTRGTGSGAGGNGIPEGVNEIEIGFEVGMVHSAEADRYKGLTFKVRGVTGTECKKQDLEVTDFPEDDEGNPVWSECSEKCGGGTQFRRRFIKKFPYCGGSWQDANGNDLSTAEAQQMKPNASKTEWRSALTEARVCNTQACPSRCLRDYEDPRKVKCSAGGKKTVNASRVVVPASGGGECPVEGKQYEVDCNLSGEYVEVTYDTAEVEQTICYDEEDYEMACPADMAGFPQGQTESVFVKAWVKEMHSKDDNGEVFYLDHENGTVRVIHEFGDGPEVTSALFDSNALAQGAAQQYTAYPSLKHNGTGLVAASAADSAKLGAGFSGTLMDVPHPNDPDDQLQAIKFSNGKMWIRLTKDMNCWEVDRPGIDRNEDGTPAVPCVGGWMKVPAVVRRSARGDGDACKGFTYMACEAYDDKTNWMNDQFGSGKGNEQGVRGWEDGDAYAYYTDDGELLKSNPNADFHRDDNRDGHYDDD